MRVKHSFFRCFAFGLVYADHWVLGNNRSNAWCYWFFALDIIWIKSRWQCCLCKIKNEFSRFGDAFVFERWTNLKHCTNRILCFEKCKNVFNLFQTKGRLLLSSSVLATCDSHCSHLAYLNWITKILKYSW